MTSSKIKIIWSLQKKIKTKRQAEIDSGAYGFTSKFKQAANFIDYFKEQMEKRKQSKGNYGNWDSSLKHLINFAGSQVSFKEVDQDFCENFRDYLKDTAKKKKWTAFIIIISIIIFF